MLSSQANSLRRVLASQRSKVLNIKQQRKFSVTSQKNVGSKKEKLVILGSGWGSYRVLQDLDHSMYDITVVSPRNHFLFTPLLCSTTTGVLEFRSIMESVRSHHQQDFQFYQGSAKKIDFNSNTIKCVEWIDPTQEFDVTYDKLVIGVGADNNTFNLPGVTPQNVYFLKELRDARAIRNKIIDLLEEASLPSTRVEDRQNLLHIVAVGGGPTCVEFVSELSDFFWSDILKFYPNIKISDLKITLVEAGDSILPAFSKELVKQAMKNIKKQGIDMRLHTRVKEVQPNKVLLDDGTSIQCGMIVWSTGVGARQFIKEMDQVPKEQGRIVVDDYLRLKGHPNVYALGDCAVLEGKPLVPTAQVAHQQGKYLAKLLNGKVPLDEKTKQPKPFVYYPLGLMAYIGSYRGLLESKFFKGSGWIEFLAWRSVYLTRLGGWKNKMFVPFNWMKTLIWGRDVTRF